MHNILETLLEISLYSSVLIVGVLAVIKLLSSRIRAILIHVLWIMVLVRLLFPFTLDTEFRFPFPKLNAKTEKTITIKDTPISETIQATTEGDFSEANYEDYEYGQELGTESIVISEVDIKTNSNVLLYLLLLWIAGAALSLAFTTYRTVIYKRKLKCTNENDGVYEYLLKHAKDMLYVKKNISIAESKCMAIPFVYGVVRPTIVFPKGFSNKIKSEKLFYIIMHELCHVKRKDILINYIWMLAKAIHWFNPIVYFAYKSYKNNVEECCDEKVISLLNNGEKCEYSQALIDTMRFSKNKHLSPLSVSLIGKEKAIRKRVMKMMEPQRKSKIMALVTILTACVMCFACFTTACRPEEASKEGQAVQTRDTDANPTPVPVSTTENVSEQEAVKPEDEIIAAINEHGLSEIGEAFLANAEDFFGDRIISYRTDGGSDSYSVLESDLSLVSFSTNQVSCWAPIGLSDEEYEAVVTDYIKRIWGIDKIEISKHEVIEQRRCTEEINSLGVAETAPAYVYSIEGTMGENRRPFAASLNGKGELNVIISFPVEVDFPKGISKNEAQSLSLEYIEEWCSDYPEIDFESFVFAGGELSLSAYSAPSFAFKYEHRGDDPSVCGFNFDCVVHVGASGGESQAIKIAPVAEDSGLIPIEEAKSLAKQYVIEKSRVEDIERLKINTGNFRMSNGETVYVFEVQYTPENPTDTNPLCYYYVTIDALKGELLDIHIGLT